MKTRFAVGILLVLCGCMVAIAQAPEWLWARSAGGINNDRTDAICTDTAGNSYICGYFTSPQIIVGADTLTRAANGFNFLIAKYDPSGNVIWAKSIGGDNVGPTGIKADINGNFYLSGTLFGDTVVFGPDTLFNAGSAYGSGFNIFTAKFNSSGQVIWATAAGGTYEDQASAISVDAMGNSYITGSVSSSEFIFGSDTIINTSGNLNIFIAKFDIAGKPVWGKIANGIDVDNGHCIATDKSGNSYTSGGFTSPQIVFGNDTLSKTSNYEVNECFIVKYDPLGNLLWAKRPENTAFSFGRAICTDADGNFYLTGSFRDTIIFDNDTLTCGVSNYSIFIAKFDTSGNVIWAENTSGVDASGSNGGAGISVDANGNSYLTGYFMSSWISFGNDTLYNTDSASTHIFVGKLDPSGNVVWVVDGGESYIDESTAISTDADGNCLITGAFQSPQIIFGNDTLINNAAPGIDNIFTAKLGNSVATYVKTPTTPSPFLTVYPNPSSGNFYFNGITPGSTIEVYNVLGETIYTAITNNNKTTLNLSSNAKGVYFYRVTDNTNSIGQGKIVLE